MPSYIYLQGVEKGFYVLNGREAVKEAVDRAKEECEDWVDFPHPTAEGTISFKVRAVNAVEDA